MKIFRRQNMVPSEWHKFDLPLHHLLSQIFQSLPERYFSGRSFSIWWFVDWSAEIVIWHSCYARNKDSIIFFKKWNDTIMKYKLSRLPKVYHCRVWSTPILKWKHVIYIIGKISIFGENMQWYTYLGSSVFIFLIQHTLNFFFSHFLFFIPIFLHANLSNFLF